MAAPSERFNPEEFAHTLARLKEGAGHGDTGPMRPNFDPKQDAEVAASAIKGRKIEDFKVALETFGFRYVEPKLLPQYTDEHGRPAGRPTEGQWRCERHQLAFTDRDLLRAFATGGAEEFVTWMEELVTRRRLGAMGLKLAKDLKGRRKLLTKIGGRGRH